MVKKIVGILLLALPFSSIAQNLMGGTKEEIRNYIAKHHPDYEPSSFKFADKQNSDAICYLTPSKQLRIYVFENSKTCTAYLNVYSNSELNRIISNFNQTFVKHGNLEWLDYGSSTTLHYKLEREADFFTVAVTKYNQK